MRDTIWKCRDKRRILVSSMEESHIRNCIAMIENSIARGRPWRAQYLERLRIELVIRGSKDLDHGKH